MIVIRPRRLLSGDRIGIIAPSAPAYPPRRLARALEALRRIGFEPVLGPVAGDSKSHADPRTRAEEIDAFVRDPSIRGIISAIGGYTTNGTLAHMDFDAWHLDPPVLIGYSDNTALHLAVLARTGLVSFHGPTLLAELGEYPEPLPETIRSWCAVTQHPVAAGVLIPPSHYTDEFLQWDQDDYRRRRLAPSPGWTWVQAGTAEGPLVGGNLETISVLVGTEYLPSFAGCVLLCETTATSPGRVRQLLTHLRSAGVLDELVGVIVARSFRAGAAFEGELRTIVAQEFAGIPIVTGVDVGHTDPMLTLPIGARLRLCSAARTITITEPAVC